MAAPCVNIFIDGDEAKSNARDLKVLQRRFSYRFRIHLEGPNFLIQYKFGPIKKLPLLINPKGPFYPSIQ